MTKYLNGHSDCTGGAAILTRQEDADKIYFLQRSAGSGLAPMDCFLVSRGVKTLAVRMKQHDANGMAVAKFLEAHPKVKRVFPSRTSTPTRNTPSPRNNRLDLARCSPLNWARSKPARRLLNHVKLCSLAESLGGVETLISHPATMTHASVPAEMRQANRNHGWTGAIVSRN